MTCFDCIESVDGIPVSFERLKAVRRGARELFISLQMMWEGNGRKVPDTWGKMSHGNKEFYRQKMKEQFPEIALCEGDWKCEYVATQTYPGWHRTHRQEKVKQEPGVKQQSKKTARASQSPIPTPGIAPGQPRLSSLPEQPHLPPAVNPSISIPIPDLHPNIHHLSSTSTTPSSVASPVTPVLNLGPNPLDPDSPTAQGVDHSKVLEESQDPNPTWSPTLFSESQLS